MRKILRTAVLICGILLMSTAVYAEMSSEISVENSAVTVNISGAEPGETISLAVLMFDRSWAGDALTDPEVHFQPGFFENPENILYFSADTADNTGAVSFAFALRNEDLSVPEYGVYPIRITGKNEAIQSMLSYASENALNSLYEEIRKANSPKELRQIFDSQLQMTILGIDTTEYSALEEKAKDAVAAAMMENRNKNPEEFKKAFRAMVKKAEFAFCNEKETLSALISRAALENTPELYGLQGKYEEYGKEKAWIDTLQTGKHYGEFLQELTILEYDEQDGLEKFFKEVRSRAALMLIRDTGYGHVPLILEGFKDVLKISLNEIPAETEENAVFKKLSGRKFASVEELRDVWKQAIKVQSSGNGNSGRPSGGGGGGIAVLPNEEKPEDGQLPEREDTVLPEEEKDFADVSPDYWAAEMIRELRRKKIVEGDGTFFYPEAAISRGEFAKLLVTFQLIREPKEKKDVPFSDVAPDAWYAEYVAIAYQSGCIQGYEDGKFKPEELITREDIAVILKRILGEIPGEADARFEDENEISDYAREAVLALSRGGIIRGNEGRFEPGKSASRAEACAMLYRTAKQND